MPDPPDRPRRVVPLRAVRRDESSVLVRLPHENALVVDELAPATAHLLSTLGASSTAHLVGLAGRSSGPSAAVLRRLARAAEEAAPMVTGQAHVRGAGPVAQALRMLVGADDHDPRPAGRVADLVVPVTTEALDLDACREWAADGTPVLPVIVRGDRTIVGPLLDGAGPCARCLELHRCDRDPHRARWLTALGPHLREQPLAQIDPVLAALTSAVAGSWVRAHLSGLAVPPRVSISIRLPWPDLRHHEWSVHPRCACWTMDA